MLDPSAKTLNEFFMGHTSIIDWKIIIYYFVTILKEQPNPLFCSTTSLRNWPIHKKSMRLI